ncbi:MAG: hypothetical protein AAFU55_11085, partial [Pseudomonadota bacterium]
MRDFFVWFGETMAGFSPAAPRARAFARRYGAPAILRWRSGAYAVEREARAGDAAPILLGEDDALVVTFAVQGEAALHGREAARIEAARRCPFPLETAVWSLTRAPEPWSNDGAVWRLIAAPAAKANALREAAATDGARPGAPFSMIGGEAAPMSDGTASRRPSPTAIAAGIALIAAVGAAAAVEIGAARITEAANARLTEARRALAEAETRAAEAETARETAAAPIRAAMAGDALFAAVPSAGAALAALTAATPDEAHMRRATIRADAVEGEFIAPDVAALARALANAPAFAGASVEGAARTDAATGLQRAV